jgi:hypothetical protein
MPSDPSTSVPTTKTIAQYVKANAAKVRSSQKMKMGHGEESVREAEYKGHKITVRTRYEVEVDGKAIMAHFGVGNSGQVHYHAVPNMAFPSAVDLVKALIDVFPEDFGDSHDGPSEHDHGPEHDHGHGGAAPMGGMNHKHGKNK